MVGVRQARPADAPAFAREVVDAWRSTYPGILPDDALAHLSHGMIEDLWREVLAPLVLAPFALVVETAGDEVVGVARARPLEGDELVAPANCRTSASCRRTIDREPAVGCWRRWRAG